MWNEVLNNFVALKRKFISQFGEESLWEYGECKNCIEILHKKTRC